MLLRNTIFIASKDPAAPAPLKIEIYVNDDIATGYWNIETNQVVLSSKLYSEFRSCGTQALQKKFFDTLKKVSDRLLA